MGKKFGIKIKGDNPESRMESAQKYAETLQVGDTLEIYYNEKNINNHVWEFRGLVDYWLILRAVRKSDGEYAYNMQNVGWLWANKDYIRFKKK